MRVRKATVDFVDHDQMLLLFDKVTSEVTNSLAGLDDWTLRGKTGDSNSHAGQYTHDLVADEAVLRVLGEADVGILSEEAGLHNGDSDVIVVVDPVDGSTNASAGLPWYATSLAAVVDGRVEVALVTNLATGQRFEATRGGGARRDGVPVRPNTTESLGDAMVAFSGYPKRYFGWRQYRSLGASALDLCAVASGTLDGFLDLHALAPWDYLGALLICEEAGVGCVDVHGRNPVVLDHEERRSMAAGVTPAILDSLIAARLEGDADNL